MKRFCTKLLPFLLVVILMAGMFPASAMAALPDISVEATTDGSTTVTTESNTPSVSTSTGTSSSGAGPEISTTPNDGSSVPASSSAPRSSEPETSALPDSSSDASSDALASADGEEITEPPTGLDGASVIFENAGGMSAFGLLQAQSTGTLHITKMDAYQWDFGFSHGGSEMRPWYIMDIDGKMAYCVEPANPDTSPGSYGTITWSGLSSAQRYAIGYAMLYGAADGSNPLFHMATQTIIWEICLGYMDLTSFTAVNKAAYNATIGYNPAAAGYYDVIVTSMHNHAEVPTFTSRLQNAAPLHNVPGIAGEYKLDLVNTNPRVSLNDFNFQGGGAVSFVRENEILHVTSSAPLDGNTLYSAFKNSVGEVESLIFWGSGGDQVRATAGVVDPVPAYFRLVTENMGQYQITVVKLESGTNSPLAGAEFNVRHSEKGSVGNYTTDGSGRLTVSVPWQGTYIITEVTPPKNHLLDESPVKDIVISTEHPSATVTFHNESFSDIQITKLDATTKARIPGVTFRIARKGGGEHQDVVTGASGIASLPNLTPDWYTIQEISTPPGYILDAHVRTVEVKSGEVCEITIENYAKPSLEVRKVDGKTGAALAGATFRIAKNGGLDYNDIVSGSDGIARLTGMEPGHYTVTEIVAPNSYILNSQPHTVEIVAGQMASITLENFGKPSLEIRKVDELTGRALAGASFRVARRGSTEFKDTVSGADGIARLTGMEPDFYIVTEIKAPDGYILDGTPQTVEVTPGQVTTITAKNGKKPTLEILKIDSITKQPLQYATFKISYKNGETIGTFTSNESGVVMLHEIDPGLLVIEEISAPDGYIVANNPQEVLLKANERKSVTFENTPKNAVILKKIDAVTGEPLAGARFRLTKMNGELIGEYTTGRHGYITIPGLQPGWYTAVELVAPEGYKLNDAPQNVELKLNGAPGILEFEDTPLPGLLLQKIDSVTKDPMAGVEFTFEKLTGERIGKFVTDENGYIFIENITEKHILVKETKTLPGYLIDTAEKLLEIKGGVLNRFEFTNTPYPKIDLKKLDSFTGEPMAGVEFQIFKVNGDLLGTYTTGEDGRVLIEDIGEQTVIIRETKTLAGYRIDETERTVKLEYGKVNTVVFTDSPYPYLVIVKIDEETKEPLPDTTFKLMNAMGKEVGTYKTNAQGKIVLTGMDAGAYKLQEMKAAEGYVLDDRVWDIALEWGKTTTVTFKNKPLKIEVTVEKRGPVEAIAGQEIQYDFRNIANHSSVALEEFYWHDLLPTDAVRLVSITTGTWGYDNLAEKGKPNPAPNYADLTYSVVYRTNLKPENWVTLPGADALNTSVNHKLDCSPQVLGLASNEYVTEFKFLFGTVKPGFREEKGPTVACRVLAELPSEYQFTNRTDVGGRYGGKWTYDKDFWTIIVYKTLEDKGKLPKTGAWV